MSGAVICRWLPTCGNLGINPCLHFSFHPARGSSELNLLREGVGLYLVVDGGLTEAHQITNLW